MRKIYFFTLLLLGLLTTNTTAQSIDLANQKSPDDWEVGGLLSINSFAGDLVSPKFSSLKATRFSLGGFGRMRISDPLHLRMGFSFGRLAASDLDFEDKQERGISFVFLYRHGAGYRKTKS